MGKTIFLAHIFGHFFLFLAHCGSTVTGTRRPLRIGEFDDICDILTVKRHRSGVWVVWDSGAKRGTFLAFSDVTVTSLVRSTTPKLRSLVPVTET